LIDSLASMTTAFILDEVTNRREHLIAEQAFFQEAILDQRLRGLADLYLQEMSLLLIEACRAFGSSHPQLDAELIHSHILATEARLLAHPEWADEQALNKRMHHLLEKLVPHD